MTQAFQTANWRFVPLARMLRALETGKRPAGGVAHISSGVPSLSAEHINESGGFDFTNLRYVPGDFYEEMRQADIEKGDILIVKDGATTGKVAFVDTEFPFPQATVNEHIFLCKPDTNLVVPRFLFWWLWSAKGYRAIRANFRGATIGGIGRDFADSVYIPLPPLDEQRRIVAIIDDQVAAVEQARAAAEAQLKAAQSLMSAYLRGVFDSQDEYEWPTVCLGDICEMPAGKSVANEGDTAVRVITTACLTETGFDPTGIKTARMRATDVAEARVSAGEVLIARSNTPQLVGRVSMFPGSPENVVASDLTFRLIPLPGLMSEFLTAYMSYLYLSRYWQERGGGSSPSMKKITKRQLKKIELRLPPLLEQQAVITRTGSIMTGINSINQGLKSQCDLINQLPAALLRRAFSGEL